MKPVSSVLTVALFVLAACSGPPKPTDPDDMQAFLGAFSPQYLTLDAVLGAETPAEDKAVVYFQAQVEGSDDRLWKAELQALEPSGWHVTRIVENDCDPAVSCWGWHNLMRSLAVDEAAAAPAGDEAGAAGDDGSETTSGAAQAG